MKEPNEDKSKDIIKVKEKEKEKEKEKRKRKKKKKLKKKALYQVTWKNMKQKKK